MSNFKLRLNLVPLKIYFISGLGADHRVFDKLSLPGYEPVHLAWITPMTNESIESYTKRLSENITDNEPILIGLSFGGIIAIEIAKHIAVKKIILISSVRSGRQLNLTYRLAGAMKLTPKIPVKLLITVTPLTFMLFGIKTKAEKDLLRKIIEDSDLLFYGWAVNALTTWKHVESTTKMIHIHGDRDHVLRMPRGVDHVVRGGGHFMVYNRAKEISALIHMELQKIIIIEEQN